MAAREAMQEELAALEADLCDEAELPVMHDPRVEA